MCYNIHSSTDRLENTWKSNMTAFCDVAGVRDALDAREILPPNKIAAMNMTMT